jgi:UDP-N-acetylmuramyl pentapeptide phosphotransferase/UDP-N-acetylglucosamine-1-phosphate transferase
MSGVVILIYLLSVFLLTVLLLFVYLKVSKHFHWFDQPNESRKIHIQAKPTSAGLIFMLPVVFGLLVFPSAFGEFSLTIGFSILVLLIMGGIDDFKPIPTFLRLIVIIFISAFLLYKFFNFESFSLLLLSIYLLGLIWWLNLYNFMDGADGMAILHAIAAILGYIIVFSMSIQSYDFAVFPYMFLLLMCLMAFLLFNYPIAKIFMGDSGSLAVAFCLAIAALYGISKGLFDEVLVISFHLVFIIDTTLTLMTRLKFKHKLTQAHNLHYFQSLIASGKSHTMVSTLYFCVSIFTIIIAVILHKINTSLSIRFSVLMIEVMVLSYIWFKFHNKTKYERFVKH